MNYIANLRAIQDKINSKEVLEFAQSIDYSAHPNAQDRK
jgi:hypothetical protein|tara:strand:- start:136 stop:252 length:117 start_codon:yes stop_codon:yes gene_type:complete